jgi:hypothetical protein
VSNSIDKVICVNETKMASRRKVLEKLGRFGAYTAPALVVGLQASKAVAASGDPGAAW